MKDFENVITFCRVRREGACPKILGFPPSAIRFMELVIQKPRSTFWLLKRIYEQSVVDKVIN